MTSRAWVVALAFIVASPGVSARGRSARQRLTTSKDALVRESAAIVLGARGDRAARATLERALAKDKNRWVRGRCAEALGRIGDGRAKAALDSALAREKNQQVRRMIGEALLRLGEKSGVREMMWQLAAGTNHSRAAAMTFLAKTMGQPLGQNAKAWWSYFSARGYAQLAGRPKGSPALIDLGAKARTSLGPQSTWRVVPTVVARLTPTRATVRATDLERVEARSGNLPDGHLIIVDTGWRAAAPSKQKAAPGLSIEALRYLQRRAPDMLGVGIDTDRIDSPLAKSRPVRAALVAKKRLVVTGLSGVARLPDSGARVLIVSRGGDEIVALALTY